MNLAMLLDDLLAALLEFVGTTFFLTMGFGGIQAANAEFSAAKNGSAVVEKVLYISLSMAFSLLVSVWLFYRVTGGVFNPNVTLSLLLIGAISPIRFVLYTIAQLAGGIAASGLILALLPGPLGVNTTRAPGINLAQGVFIEAFVTSALVLTILMLAVEKHAATPFAPIGIGLTLFACHLFSVFWTGASMNTARSFGPAAVTGFPSNDHWIYWVGPYAGSLFATGLYWLLKRIRYTHLNAGQDTTDLEKSPGFGGGAPPAVVNLAMSTSGSSGDADHIASLQK